MHWEYEGNYWGSWEDIDSRHFLSDDSAVADTRVTMAKEGGKAGAKWLDVFVNEG